MGIILQLIWFSHQWARVEKLNNLIWDFYAQQSNYLHAQQLKTPTERQN